MIGVQEHFCDRQNVNERLDETESRRKHAPSLDDGRGADGIERHVGDSRQNDQHEGDGDRSVHTWVMFAVVRSLSFASGFSGIDAFAAAWWFTMRREPRWPVR